MKIQSYLEIFAPFTYEEPWFSNLRKELSLKDIWWQKNYYHITMAFLDETPESISTITDTLKEKFEDFHAQTITFDKLDAFTGPNGIHFITLTSSNIPAQFYDKTIDIRNYLASSGGIMNSDFKPHITLGRISSTHISLESLKEALTTIAISPITLTLDKVDYRIFKGDALFQKTLPLQ